MEKIMQGPRPGQPFCESPRSQNAHGHVPRAILCQNLQKNDAPRLCRVRACAVDMHMDMSQEQLYARIYRKKAGEQMEHPDQALALTLAVRTPQCEDGVFGEKTPCNTNKDPHEAGGGRCVPIGVRARFCL